MKIFLRFFTASLLIVSVLETQAVVRYVRPSAAGLGNGISWTNASNDLQDMINQSSAGDTVCVAAGRYVPIRPANDLLAIDSNNRNNAFVVKSNIYLYGGFPDNTTSVWSDRDWNAYPTVLCGDIGTPNDMNDNCYHVLILTKNADTASVDGFTITRGNAAGSNSIIVDGDTIYRNYGGGIYNSKSSPLLLNLIINENMADFGGGGICNSSAASKLANAVINGNNAQNGGGIYNAYSTPTLSNIIFYENSASSSGGGIFNNN